MRNYRETMTSPPRFGMKTTTNDPKSHPKSNHFIVKITNYHILVERNIKEASISIILDGVYFIHAISLAHIRTYISLCMCLSRTCSEMLKGDVWS